MLIRAVIIGAALCAVLCGCGREEVSEPVYESRMDDPIYRSALQQQADARKDIMKLASEVKREYDEAVTVDPESEKTKALKAKLEEINAEFLANREESMKLVRERIHSDFKVRKGAKAKKD